MDLSIARRFTAASLVTALVLTLLSGFGGPRVAAAQSYVFTGHGYGHGVGLSMAGVYDLAKNRGKDYREILNYYYADVKWETRSDDQVIRAICAKHGSEHILTIREYLYRLAEEPDTWPREGLRTLMVAARTYVWYKLKVHGYMPGGQVFWHHIDPAKKPNIVAAVKDTEGQILTYDGDPIVAAYSASSGGWTAGVEDVWGSAPKPYLKPVETPWDKAIQSTYEWSKEVSAAEIESAFPGIGRLLRMEVTERNGYGDWGGRVKKMVFHGTSGSETVSGENVRRKLGLKSNWFYFAPGNQRRLEGQTSHGTAVSISQSAWSASKIVLLARDDFFSDALAGVPLAYSYKSDPGVDTPVPLLLTGSNDLSSESLNEMKRLGAKVVIILGGPAAISEGAAQELRDNDLIVDRIWQENAYGTAADIARRMYINASNWGSKAPDTAVIATGENFADALAVSSPAGANNMPVVLVRPKAIPPETASLLNENQIKNVIIVGGPGAVHPDVEDALRKKGLNVLARLWGADQYETSASIADHGDPLFKFTRPGAVFVSRGDHYVDGVAAGALAARMNPAPILLVDPDELPPPVQSFISEKKDFIDRVYIIGGRGAVSARVEDAIGLVL